MRHITVSEDYELFEDGTILNKKTEKIIKSSYSKTRNNPMIVKLSGKTYTLSRLVYNAFSEDKASDNDVIGYLDNDKSNCNINNLVKYNRKEFRTKVNPKKIDEKTAKKILQEYQADNLGCKGKGVLTYKMLADKYQVSICLISKIVNGQYFITDVERKKIEDEKDRQKSVVASYLKYLNM